MGAQQGMLEQICPMNPNNYNDEMVVYTGGSNAGKSSVMGFLARELQRYGIKAFILHEVATNLFNAGINHQEVPNTQELIITKMINDEDALRAAARAYTGPLRPVVICDRGIMDCKIFCKPGEFETIIATLGYTEQQIKNRYSLVIHLRSTAIGSSDVFERTFGDNKVRIEKSRAEVAEGDAAIETAWTGHRDIQYIPLQENFDDKQTLALQTLLRGLGMPIPQSTQKKFLVPATFSAEAIERGNTVSLTQYYLESSPKRALMNYPKDAERFTEMIRMTFDGSGYTYTYTLKAFTPHETQPYVLHDILTQDEFVQMVAFANGRPIKKERTYFPWNNQYFQYDKFQEPIDEINSGVLEVRPSLSMPQVVIPAFIPAGNEVTTNIYYENYSIAKRLK